MNIPLKSRPMAFLLMSVGLLGVGCANPFDISALVSPNRVRATVPQVVAPVAQVPRSKEEPYQLAPAMASFSAEVMAKYTGDDFVIVQKGKQATAIGECDFMKDTLKLELVRMDMAADGSWKMEIKHSGNRVSQGPTDAKATTEIFPSGTWKVSSTDTFDPNLRGLKGDGLETMYINGARLQPILVSPDRIILQKVDRTC